MGLVNYNNPALDPYNHVNVIIKKYWIFFFILLVCLKIVCLSGT